MNSILVRIFIGCFSMLAVSACQTKKNENTVEKTKSTEINDTFQYHGIFSSSEYDSVVNHLILYPNETFDLSQIDRIAEHHLNERQHQGIYSYLADSTQLGLFTNDGVLMLRFKLVANGLTPMNVGGDKVLDPLNVWQPEKTESK